MEVDGRRQSCIPGQGSFESGYLVEDGVLEDDSVDVGIGERGREPKESRLLRSKDISRARNGDRTLE